MYKRIPLSRRTKILLQCIAAILLIFLIGLSIYLIQNNRQKIDKKELTALVEAGDCKKSIQELGDAKDNPNKKTDSVALLSYRSSCYLRERNYRAAINDLEKLRSYYKTPNDASIIAIINDNIAFAKYKITNPTVKKSTTPSFHDPELERYLETLRSK